MSEILLDRLRLIAEELPVGRFWLPDGIAEFRVPFPNQPYDRLLIVLAGEKHEPMSIDGKLREVVLRPGDAYLIRKYLPEAVSFSHTHRLLCIIPRGRYLRLSSYDIRGGRPHVPWPEPEVIHTDRPCSEALKSVFAALGDPASSGGTHVGFLVRAAAVLALEECLHEGGGAGKAVVTFDRIRGYLEKHFVEDLTREDLAAKFGLNASYVSQLFRKMCGRSFQEYLTDCRIGMAKTLLRNSPLPVKAVAERCGFSGEVYFIRRFREVTGCSPGRFRLEKMQNGESD